MKWLVIALLLAACDGPLSLLGGGGPNVAANVQAGKTNTQSLGGNEFVEQSVRQAETVTQSADQNQVRTERVETITVRNDIPPWVLLLLLLGWLLPSPGQIGNWISEKVFRRGRG